MVHPPVSAYSTDSNIFDAFAGTNGHYTLQLHVKDGVLQAMNNVAGIEIKKGSHPSLPWEVHTAKRIFGKRSVKKFKNKAQAEAHALKLSRRAINNEN